MEIDMYDLKQITTTKFDKKLFSYSGGFLTYGSEENGKRKQVVARFKHKGPFTKAKFLKELIANHTVEEYFMSMEIGRKAPLAILRDKNEEWYYGILEAFGGHDLRKAA
jgi:hypothetical protein